MNDAPRYLTLDEAERTLQADAWPEPDWSIVDYNRRPPPELPIDIFGPFWSAWITSAAEGASAPRDYVASSLLAIAAAMVGNARWVSPWGDWLEPPIIWIANVGAPSSGKSPATDAILRLVRTLESDMAQGYEDEYRCWQTACEAAKVAYEAWQSEVKTAAKENVPPPEISEKAIEPTCPPRPRILVTDATIEALARLMAGLPRGLLHCRDELTGWLCNFDRYGGSGGDRAFWIEAYGGRFYVIDRVRNDGAPITIPRLLVGVLGGIQPDRLASILMHGDDDGLAARMMYVWPHPISPRRPRSIADHQSALNAFRRLLKLEFGEDENGPTPVTLKFTEPATDRIEAWMKDHAKADPGGMLGGHFGKMPGFVARLGLILEFLWWSASDDEEPRAISDTAVLAAIAFVEQYVKPMAERCFGDAALPEAEKNAVILAKYVMAERPEIINAREIRRNRLPGLDSAAKVDAAIRVLVEANWLRPSPTRSGDTTGRNRKDFSINPKVFQNGRPS